MNSIGEVFKMPALGKCSLMGEIAQALEHFRQVVPDVAAPTFKLVSFVTVIVLTCSEFSCHDGAHLAKA